MNENIPVFPSVAYSLGGIKFKQYKIDNDYCDWKFKCPNNNNKILIYDLCYDYEKMNEYEDQKKFYKENLPYKHQIHFTTWNDYQNSCLDYSYFTYILEFIEYDINSTSEMILLETNFPRMLETYRLFANKQNMFEEDKEFEIDKDWNPNFITEINFKTHKVYNVKKNLDEIMECKFSRRELEKNMKMNNYIIEIGDYFSKNLKKEESDFVNKFVEFKVSSLVYDVFNKDTSVYKSILELAEFAKPKSQIENTHPNCEIYKYEDKQYEFFEVNKKNIEKNTYKNNIVIVMESDLFNMHLGKQKNHKIHFRNWRNILLSDIVANEKSESLYYLEILDEVSDYDLINIYRDFVMKKFGDLYLDFPEDFNFNDDLLSSDIICINTETHDITNV